MNFISVTTLCISLQLVAKNGIACGKFCYIKLDYIYILNELDAFDICLFNLIVVLHSILQMYYITGFWRSSVFFSKVTVQLFLITSLYSANEMPMFTMVLLALVEESTRFSIFCFTADRLKAKVNLSFWRINTKIY